MSTGTETISGRPARLGTSRLGSSLRLAATLATTLLGLLFVTFIIGRVMPIDPVLAVIGERATQAQYDEVFRDLGLDKPLLVQFAIYVRDVVTFDFGTSIRTGKPVAEDLARVFPATFELATIGTLMGVVLGVPMGVAAAVFRGRWIDQVVRVIGLIGYSIPVFWLGLVGLLIFYGILGWVAGPGRLGVFYQGLVPERTGLILIDSAIVGDWTVFRDAFSHIILPA